MDLRTARDAGQLDHTMGRRARVAVLDQTFHGRIEQPGAHLRTALGLSASGDARVPARGHRGILLGVAGSHQQTYRLGWQLLLRDLLQCLRASLRDQPCSERHWCRAWRPVSQPATRARSPTTRRRRGGVVGGAATRATPPHAVASPPSHPTNIPSGLNPSNRYAVEPPSPDSAASMSRPSRDFARAQRLCKRSSSPSTKLEIRSPRMASITVYAACRNSL